MKSKYNRINANNKKQTFKQNGGNFIGKALIYKPLAKMIVSFLSNNIDEGIKNLIGKYISTDDKKKDLIKIIANVLDGIKIKDIITTVKNVASTYTTPTSPNVSTTYNTNQIEKLIKTALQTLNITDIDDTITITKIIDEGLKYMLNTGTNPCFDLIQSNIEGATKVDIDNIILQLKLLLSTNISELKIQIMAYENIKSKTTILEEQITSITETIQKTLKNNTKANNSNTKTNNNTNKNITLDKFKKLQDELTKLQDDLKKLQDDFKPKLTTSQETTTTNSPNSPNTNINKLQTPEQNITDEYVKKKTELDILLTTNETYKTKKQKDIVELDALKNSFDANILEITTYSDAITKQLAELTEKLSAQNKSITDNIEQLSKGKDKLTIGITPGESSTDPSTIEQEPNAPPSNATQTTEPKTIDPEPNAPPSNATQTTEPKTIEQEPLVLAQHQGGYQTQKKIRKRKSKTHKQFKNATLNTRTHKYKHKKHN